MKLLFDLSATQAENGVLNHGGSEYAKAVFFKLIERSSESVSVFYNHNLALENSVIELIDEYSLKTVASADINSIIDFIKTENINVFYSALIKAEYLPLIAMQSESFKVIITIHGLRSLELPTDKYEWYYCHTLKSKLKFIYKKIFHTYYKNSILDYFRKFLDAAEIITVSDHSKRSLVSFFPEISAQKVTVLYSPLIDYRKESDRNAVIKSTLSPRKYFLVLSGSIWSKNSIRAVKAFDDLISYNKEFKQIKMVITGIEKPFYQPINSGNFLVTGYLNRETLEDLYRNALALVYPTLNEGFGYPPLEAFKYGTPVFASEVGPIPEVCGNAAEYFNPFKIDEVKDSLYNALVNPDLFSETNCNLRINRYKIIRSRQETDLKKLIELLNR
jgi:glycosyltransferase involved in cell wall biosynthesis